MVLYIEEAHYLLTILLVMIGLAEVESRVYATCDGKYGYVQRCTNSRSTKCCYDGFHTSRCCSPTTCGVHGLCTTWAIRFCCQPEYSYGSSTCCNSWSYSYYSAASDRSSWSSYSKSSASSWSSSSSSSSRSYLSSWSSSWARKEAASTRQGMIAGSVVGGIVFIIFAVVIPVVVCRNAAARSSDSQGRVIALAQQGQQQGQYPGGPQIAGVIPHQAGQFQTSATAPTVEYRPPYYQGQQYPPPTNPVYQPSAPTEMPVFGQQQPSSAPPPTYDAAVALLQKT